MKREVMMLNAPDFIIIGAMKSATTTLYDQLVEQPGIFMPDLKEPNYFSDDEQYFHGEEWYSALFDAASDGDILGEASTHYTKLPTYPDTLHRMQQRLASPRLIYIMRHPIERLISHYIHEWTQGNIVDDIDQAIEKHPELIAYSRYAFQLEPYLKAYGGKGILPIFFEDLRDAPQLVLERVCRFIGYRNRPLWNSEILPRNISKDRIRKFPLYDLLIESSLAEFFRHTFIPVSVRERVKQRFQMRERPVLCDKTSAALKRIFDADLSLLGDYLGVQLNCENYHTVVTRSNLSWKVS